MSHLLYALEDYFEERAHDAGRPALQTMFGRISKAAGSLGGAIDALAAPLKRFLLRR